MQLYGVPIKKACEATFANKKCLTRIPGLPCICVWHGILVWPAWLVSYIRPCNGCRMYVEPLFGTTVSIPHPPSGSLQYSSSKLTNTFRVSPTFPTESRTQRPRNVQRPQRRLVSCYSCFDPRCPYQRCAFLVRVGQKVLRSAVCKGYRRCYHLSPRCDGHRCIPALQVAKPLQYQYGNRRVGQCLVVSYGSIHASYAAKRCGRYVC